MASVVTGQEASNQLCDLDYTISSTVAVGQEWRCGRRGDHRSITIIFTSPACPQDVTDRC